MSCLAAALKKFASDEKDVEAVRAKKAFCNLSRCRALFYECVKNNCGHNFCRDCMPEGKECLQCGDQVTDVRPDPKVQGAAPFFMMEAWPNLIVIC